MKKKIVAYSLGSIIFIALGTATFLSAKEQTSRMNKDNKYESNNYGISASNKVAVDIGMRVLEKGGNAVDAAIAVSYALGVVEPHASGIGGGGGMLIYNPKEDEYDFFNYRDSAPITKDTKKSSVGVPGFVSGMERIHEKYGTLDVDELINPAIEVAEKGFPIYDELHNLMNSSKNIFLKIPHYTNNEELLKKGDILIQKELANTLRKIRDGGADEFYHGDIAKSIERESILNLKDLDNYRVDNLKPVKGKYGEFEIVSAPPPFSGITLIQMIKAMEKLQIPNIEDDEEKYLEILNKATLLAYNDRLRNIGDPNFVDIDYEKHVQEEYINKLLKLNLEDEIIEEEEHESTTHFVIRDKDGMMVSCTNTLGNFWGSKVYVDGFFLNNAVNNFSTNINSPNIYKPGKKPRNFTSPTIISKDGEFMLGIGSPGGNRIPKILAPVFIDYFRFGTDLQVAINKPRIIFDDDNLILETTKVLKHNLTIKSTKYKIIKKSNPSYFGCIQALGWSKEKGITFGGTDPRRDGKISIK